VDKFIEIFHKIYDPISPKQFDENEWWILFLCFLMGFAVFYLHKKCRLIATTELLLIFLFNTYFGDLGDYVLAMPPVDLYDTVDLNSGEFFDILLHAFVYPCTMYVLLHFYLLLNPKKSFYIVLCAAILTFLEWISIHFFHLFTYKGWNLIFSFIFYLGVMTLNLLILTGARKKVIKCH
jgi:hypothetical protein